MRQLAMSQCDFHNLTITMGHRNLLLSGEEVPGNKKSCGGKAPFGAVMRDVITITLTCLCMILGWNIVELLTNSIF